MFTYYDFMFCDVRIAGQALHLMYHDDIICIHTRAHNLCHDNRQLIVIAINHFFSDYFQNRAFLAVFETFLKNGINRIGKKVYF